MNAQTKRNVTAIGEKPFIASHAVWSSQHHHDLPAVIDGECASGTQIWHEVEQIGRDVALAAAHPAPHEFGMGPAHDLENLVCQTVDDVAQLASSHVFVFESRPQPIHVLGDKDEIIKLIMGVLHSIVAFEPRGADITLWGVVRSIGDGQFAGLRLCTQVSSEEADRAARILPYIHRYADAMGGRLESYLSSSGYLEAALWMPCLTAGRNECEWQVAA